MSNAAHSRDPRYVPNHTVNPLTGFIESKGYVDAFDSDKKLSFLSVYKKNALKFYRTCGELGVKDETVKKALAIDPAFKAAFERAKTEYYDELEGISRDNALNPKSVIERIFQLKAAFPEKYGDGKRESNLNVQINLGGKDFNIISSREQALNVTDATKVVENTPNDAPESISGDGDI